MAVCFLRYRMAHIITNGGKGCQLPCFTISNSMACGLIYMLKQDRALAKQLAFNGPQGQPFQGPPAETSTCQPSLPSRVPTLPERNGSCPTYLECIGGIP